MNDKQNLTGQRTDPSPVIALLLAQYNSIERERLVVATSMRILWFALLMALALITDTETFTLAFLGIIAMALFVVSSYRSRRAQRRELHIRDSLVRLDPELQDYYIKALHETREPKYHWSLLTIVARYEDIIWLVTCIYIILIKVVILKAIIGKP